MNSPDDRVHAAADLDAALNNWPYWYEEHILITPAGPFTVQREQLYTLARPSITMDFQRLFGQTTPSASRQNQWQQPQSLRRLPAGKLVMENKISWSLLTQARSFFQTVWKQFHREDILLLYWTPPQGYVLVHPTLTSASEAHLRYELPETPVGGLRLGTLHLHHDHPYQSPTDLDDELVSPGIHVVIGHIAQPLPALVCTASDGRCCVAVSPTDIFMDPPPEPFPAEWLVEAVSRHHFS